MSQFEPNFNVSAIEQVKVMRSFYENAIKSLKVDIAVLESTIKKTFKEFSISESEQFGEKMKLIENIMLLKKEKLFLELSLEQLNAKGAELSDEEIANIQATVLEQTNEEHRKEISDLQGIELDQNVEDLRESLKPIYRYIAKIIHPDLHNENEKEFRNAFQVFSNFYDSNQITGISAISNKIIPNIITIIESKLSTDSAKFTQLSQIDVNQPEYYQLLVDELKSIASQSETDKDIIVTSILTVLQPHSVPDNLKTNEDLYLETLQLEEKKKQLNRVIDLIKQNKSHDEIMQSLGMDTAEVDSYKLEIENLSAEIEELQDKVAEKNHTIKKSTVDSLNNLYNNSALVQTPTPSQEISSSKQESELSVENQIEKDKQDYEKAKVVIKRFIEDIENGRWETRERDGDPFFNIDMKTDLGWFGYDLNKDYTEVKILNRAIHHFPLNLQMRNDFKKAFVHSFIDKKYNNSGYYRDLNTINGISWEYYHSGTFEEVYSLCKAELKEYVGIDLDELYGVDGTKNLDSVESAKFDNQQKSNEKLGLVTAKHENQIEKRDKWNPKNFEETLQAVKELEKAAEKIPGVIVKKNKFQNKYFFQVIKNNKLNTLEIAFYTKTGEFVHGKGISSTYRTFNTKTKFSDFSSPSYYKTLTRNDGLLLESDEEYVSLCNFEGSIYQSYVKSDEANPDFNGPLVFQSLKKKLKVFGINLDSM
jgi:hypothetical protein